MPTNCTAAHDPDRESRIEVATQSSTMGITSNITDPLQIRLTSAVETILASLAPYAEWIEQVLDAPLSDTLTIEVDCNPGDVVAEELLQGLSIASATRARNSYWRKCIEGWTLPPGVSPRIAASIQRERKPNAAPFPVWEPDWQDCPVAFKMHGIARRVVGVKIPMYFPPADMPMCGHSSGQRQWLIVHREDVAKVLLLKQEVQVQTERYLETAHGRTRLQGKYDWDSVVMDSTVKRMVRRDFEIFFQREDWFRQHNLPYRRGYLLWGDPGNGKTAAIRVMAAHPFIQPYTLDLSDDEQKSSDVRRLFEAAAENTPALVILEDLDRAFPTEGKRTQERAVSFQTLLNSLDGVGSQDGVIVVATANDPTCLDAAILKRPGRFDRVVQFRNPDANLRREYYRRLNATLGGGQFEIAIEQTEGFSFAQLRETYILGAQSAFEQGKDIGAADVIEAIELQTAGAQDLKTSVTAPGFVQQAEPQTSRK
jgi:AAA+ superfamily predicted ATPase